MCALASSNVTSMFVTGVYGPPDKNGCCARPRTATAWETPRIMQGQPPGTARTNSEALHTKYDGDQARPHGQHIHQLIREQRRKQRGGRSARRAGQGNKEGHPHTSDHAVVGGRRMACSARYTGTNRGSTAGGLHGPHGTATSTCTTADKTKTTRSSATAARRPRPTAKGRRRPKSAQQTVPGRGPTRPCTLLRRSTN